MPPKCSIVLPTFNGSVYIRQSIESCLMQSFTDLELIVVDDGSTDRTSDVVRSFHDSRIRLIRLEHNRGHIAALNRGFSESRGDLLTWTSDDNYYAPQALQMMVEQLDRFRRVDFVYAAYQVIDQRGNNIRLGRSENPDYLDIDNCVGGCFLYRRCVYETIGDFNTQAFLAEDYEYWLRVRSRFRMKRLPQVLYFYRMHERSLTGAHREEKVQEQVQKVRDRLVPKWKRILRRIGIK